jgi:hypothetical protein
VNIVDILTLLFLSSSSLVHYEFIDITRWQRNDINAAVHANPARQRQEFSLPSDK